MKGYNNRVHSVKAYEESPRLTVGGGADRNKITPSFIIQLFMATSNKAKWIATLNPRGQMFAGAGR